MSADRLPFRHSRSSTRIFVFLLACLSFPWILEAQAVPEPIPENRINHSDADHVQQRNEWFFRGRLVPGTPSAELRRRAFQRKLAMRAERAMALGTPGVSGTVSEASGSWTPLRIRGRGLARHLTFADTNSDLMRRSHPGTASGTYKITVTGSSPGISADPTQSTQVTLVVN